MDTKNHKHGSSKKGFSLIELVTVVAIIGVLASISFPLFHKWLPNMRLKDATQDLYGYMQKARLGAVKTNSDWAIVFDSSNNTYTLYSDWDADNDNEGVISLGSYRSGVKFGHGDAPTDVSDNAFVVNEISSYPGNTVKFNSLGTGSTGYVYLDHEKNTTAFVVGSLSSGVIKVKRWVGGAWEQ